MDIENREDWQDATIRARQPDIENSSGGVFFNAYYFLRHLTTYDDIHCMCYTFNGNLLVPSIHITRAICSKFFKPQDKSYCKKLTVKLVSNSHSKLYLCYTHGKLADVFMGSWNFNSPSYLELMCCLPNKQHKKAKLYFDTIWNDRKGV